MNLRSWVSGAIVALVLSAVAVGGVLAFRAHQSPANLYADAELSRLDGPGTVRLASYRGRPLALNFFASWCPSCAAEMPGLDQEYRDSTGGFELIGVDARDTRSAGLDLARRLGVTYPLAFDDGDHLYKQLQGEGMPITAFFRSNGSLMQVYIGALDHHLFHQIINSVR